MNPIKAIIRRLPGGEALTDYLSYRRRNRRLEKIGDPEARFTHIYAENKWKDAESRSGSGSSQAATVDIRETLPRLLRQLGVSRLLDAPCGDFNWFRLIERDPSLHYIGGDIVRPLIEANNSAHADQQTEFVTLDITRDPLPDADLWLCRDCLIHLSYADIEKAAENFLSSQIPWWLVTTHTRITRNKDIPTGHCRMINLALPPFNFGEPDRYLPDTDLENTGKSLGLWRRETLAEILIDLR